MAASHRQRHSESAHAFSRLLRAGYNVGPHPEMAYPLSDSPRLHVDNRWRHRVPFEWLGVEKQ